MVRCDSPGPTLLSAAPCIKCSVGEACLPLWLGVCPGWLRIAPGMSLCAMYCQRLPHRPIRAKSPISYNLIYFRAECKVFFHFHYFLPEIVQKWYVRKARMLDKTSYTCNVLFKTGHIELKTAIYRSSPRVHQEYMSEFFTITRKPR